MIFKRSIYLFSLLLCISGCGYTTSSTLPSNIRTVYVGPFQNKIDFAQENRRNLYVPLIEVDARNAVIDQFLFDGHLKITDEDAADMILVGKLIGYERSALRFTDNDDVQEYRVHIICSFEMTNASTGEIEWTESSFVGEDTYFALGSQAEPEESAVKGAIKDLAKRIVERTIENW